MRRDAWGGEQTTKVEGAGRVDEVRGTVAERKEAAVGNAGRSRTADERGEVAYLFTTFPKGTETFLQREVRGMRTHGVRLRLYSMWGGGGVFDEVPVTRFPKWRLAALIWRLPWLAAKHPRVVAELVRGVAASPPRSCLQLMENLLGLGFALVFAGHFRRIRPAHVHAVWGGAPAAAAWLVWRLTGVRYSAAGHAYDLYRDDGDPWLREKLAPAAFVHTSTEMGRRTLIERGVAPGKIHVVRRGLTELPPLKPLRSPRGALRLLCVARLVPKKGLDHQLRVYAALKRAGIAFEARIAGEGPLRGALEKSARELGLNGVVRFLGHRPQSEIAALLEWADVLLHTGVVAADGDRDGLPNVIPEAMAAGVLVVTSPAAATTEAITDKLTGRVCEPHEADLWVEILRELSSDSELAGRLRWEARRWVEQQFDAKKNAARLAALAEEAMRETAVRA